MIATLFITLFALMFLSVPIALSISIASITVFTAFFPGMDMISMLAQSLVTSADNFSVMAIPFFMLVGTLMEKSGIAKQLIHAAEAIAGEAAGGLGAAAIIAAVLFSAISGSGPAVVAAIGGIMIPTMTKRGYAPAYSGALVASGGIIGPIIPPSIPMIMYGITAGVSVIKLFTGGILPGLMMGAALFGVNYVISKKRLYVGVPREVNSAKWVIRQVWNAKWALLMPVIVLGGIYAGFCSPTEAAVVGIAYTLIVGLLTRELNLAKISSALVEAAISSATVMILVGGAQCFGRLLILSHIPEMLTEWMLGITNSPIIIMLLINVFLLFGGMFIDTVSNVVLFTPLFLPIVTSLGYSPVYFGVVMTVNLCIGFLTPPLGMNLFIAQSVSHSRLEDVIKEVIPFMVAALIILIILTAFPDIIMCMANLVG